MDHTASTLSTVPLSKTWIINGFIHHKVAFNEIFTSFEPGLARLKQKTAVRTYKPVQPRTNKRHAIEVNAAAQTAVDPTVSEDGLRKVHWEQDSTERRYLSDGLHVEGECYHLISTVMRTSEPPH